MAYQSPPMISRRVAYEVLTAQAMFVIGLVGALMLMAASLVVDSEVAFWLLWGWFAVMGGSIGLVQWDVRAQLSKAGHIDNWFGRWWESSWMQIDVGLTVRAYRYLRSGNS